MSGYTLQQIQQMGGTPVAPPQPTQSAQGYTLQQIQQMGGTPTATPQTQSNPIGGFVGNILAPVKNLAGEMAAGSNQGQAIEQGVSKSDNQMTNADYSYLKQINQNLQTAIKDGNATNIARYKKVLSNFQFTDGTQMSDVFPNINDTDEQVIGNTVGTGLLAMSGGLLETGTGAVEGAVEGAVKGTQTIGQALKQGAAIGGTYGAIGSGAASMSQNDSAGNVAINTGVGGAEGAITGAATAGVLHGTFNALGAVSNKLDDTLSSIAQAIKDKLSGVTDNSPTDISGTSEAIDIAKANVADAYQKSMPLTNAEKIKETNLLNRTGDNVFTTLAKYNISPASDDAISDLHSLSDRFANATQQAQQNENALFNIDEIKKNTFQNINENLNSASARKVAQAKITNEFNDLIEETPQSFIKGANGETLAGSDIVERLRKTGNDWTPFNASDPEKVGSSAGYALSDAVRDQVDKQGTFPAYREANSEWGKVIHAQEVLQKIENSGKTFKVMGGLSGSIARKILSGVIGYHLGGVGGAILNELGTEYASRLLSNPDLRTYFDRQLIEKFGNTDATPAVIDKLTQQIRDYIDTQTNLPRLPAPSYIEAGAPKDTSGIEVTPAKKNLPVSDPKTGKMKTNYSSSAE